MTQYPSRRKIGVRKVEVQDLRHVIVHRDENMYLYATNRGGIWNFGDGEIAVAYLALPMNYEAIEEGANQTWSRHCGGPRRMWGQHERWGSESGAIISRSFDNGETWPDNERQWIWNNDRTTEEILDWLRPVDPKERDQIDLGDPDSIIHFCHGDYLKFPIGRVGKEPGSFDLGRRHHAPSFALRSKDRGRTWENHATLIDNPSWAPDGGYLSVNLGHVRFDNGVLGIVGGVYRRNSQCYYVSYNNGASWSFLSEVARVNSNISQVGGGDENVGYNYSGVHKLPDGRLMCLMHQHPPEMPCVAFSEDDGVTWSKPQFVVGPGTHYGNMSDPEPPRALYDLEYSRQRSPAALVTRDGRIIVLFARRTASLGCRGICGVVSDDLGETWSEEFVVRGDGYSYDLGYEVLTELPDGRIFTAYWFVAKEGEDPIPEPQCVRHIAGSSFRLS